MPLMLSERKKGENGFPGVPFQRALAQLLQLSPREVHLACGPRYRLTGPVLVDLPPAA